MKQSQLKSYDDLPLFLDAELVSQVLEIAPSSCYELMHENGFPVLRVGEPHGRTQRKIHTEGGAEHEGR